MSGLCVFPPPLWSWFPHPVAVRKPQLLIILLGCWTVAFAPAAEPSALRAWTAKSGHKLEAKAVQIADGKVHLERADGSKVLVELDKFTEADQAALRQHFALGEASTPGGAVVAPAAGAPADDLPYPLGKATEEIPCGDDFSYFLYFPNSLRKGAKHPVLFVMNPGGGSGGDAERYRAGAERNRWIIAVSKQSSNGFDGSQNAVDSMIRQVTSKLPIDKKRMYVSGFSGGSRMAFATAGKNKDIAGVIACGAGGNLGSAKQVAYGLCGTNCFNRTDMANSFRGFKNKECVLRYFAGQHEWAGDELCDDAITHLNGVFVLANRAKYPDDCAFYIKQVNALIEGSAGTAPMRAYLWSSFLTSNGVKDLKLASVHATLGQDEKNKLHVKGLTDVSEFAQKSFGEISGSQWQADPKIAAACKKEAKKYAGTPWEDILSRMAEDAQKF